jgi:argininosuccinate synthase
MEVIKRIRDEYQNDEQLQKVADMLQTLIEESVIIMCKKCDDWAVDSGLDATLKATSKDGNIEETNVSLCEKHMVEFLETLENQKPSEVEIEMEDGVGVKLHWEMPEE